MRRRSVLLAAAMLTASAGAAAQQPTDAGVDAQSVPVTTAVAPETDEQELGEDVDAAPEAVAAEDADADADAAQTPRRPATSPATPAASTAGSTDAWRRITEAELAAPSTSYPYIEWHGYFRFRSDSFWNLDLSTNGTSSQLPPIEALLNGDTRNNGAIADIPGSVTTGDGSTIELSRFSRDKSKFISSANMRFRLQPIFHVAQSASIHLQLDIFDNLILGSTPYQGDQPLSFFSDSQRSPTAAEFGRDAVRVSAAYGEIRSFLGTLRVGRMPNHWGLGMMFNSGGHYSAIREPRLSNRNLGMAGNTCLDCDHGDYVDRASFSTTVFDHHIMLAYDYNMAGATQGAEDAFGRPRDLGQFDDTRSFVLSVARRAETPEEIARRNRKLSEQGKPVFDYGAYLMYRTQRVEADQCTTPSDPSSCNFLPRGAQMFVPNLWLRLEHQPAFRRHLRIEGELAAIIGNIDFAANSLSGLSDNAVDRQIRQVAGALEFEYTNYAYSLGFNAGFASGRQTGGSNPGLGANYETDMINDQRFTAFFFDRDYFIDMIMFREVIGTVTNALYLNPFFQYDLFSKRNDTLGLRIDLIGAVAANAEATPSGQGFYGAEGNLTIYYRQPRYGVDLSTALFLPGNAFNAVEGRPRFANHEGYLGDSYGSTYLNGEASRAKPATSLQARFFWAF